MLSRASIITRNLQHSSTRIVSGVYSQIQNGHLQHGSNYGFRPFSSGGAGNDDFEGVGEKWRRTHRGGSTKEEGHGGRERYSYKQRRGDGQERRGFETVDRERGFEKGRRERGFDKGDQGRGFDKGDRGFDEGDRGFGKGGRESGSKHGRPPPGLSGKEIGMYYARRSKAAGQERDRRNRSFVQLDENKERDISGLLRSIQSMDYDNQEVSCESERNSITVTGNDQLERVTFGDEDFLDEYEQHKIDNQRNWEELSNSDLGGNDVELYQDITFDSKMYSDLMQKKSNPKYQKMMAFRKSLPSYAMKEELLKTINSSQVTVISGETGCGKTTQVPQFLLDEAIEQNKASICRILCTQPRRISAISVAERVAQERCEECGTESTVGYQIRLEKKLPESRGSILFCTTGIILQWLASNPLLKGTSHIVMDEVHERDLHSDFLMIILRDVLPRRPDLKLILMSATLNAEMFSQYFDNCPMLNIPGYTFPVTDYLLEDAIELIGYQPYPAKPNGFSRKDAKNKQKERERFSDWCHSIDSRKYSNNTIRALETIDHSQVDIELACHLAEFIMKTKPDGAILVFLPGWSDIKKMNDQLQRSSIFSQKNSRIIPLHSMMPTMNQREVFERPPPGVRKIVLATNIAETSITIDDVVYVIDCGKIKLKTFDAENNISTLQVENVSRANAKQRRGRAGRVQAGECYHLFTQYHRDNFADYQLPEMLRTRLEDLCLQIKLLKLGKVEPIVQKAIEPPSMEALHASLEMLRDINALDDNEDLTPLGYHLAKMPVDPHTGKMLLFGAMFSCLNPILTVAASLSYKNAFVIPMGHEADADRRRRALSEGSQSDHLMLVNAYEGWELSQRDFSYKQYCWVNFLSSNVLHLLKGLRKQFATLMQEMQFTHMPNPNHKESNLNSDKDAIVKAVICAGLYPNVAKVTNPKKSFKKHSSTKLRTKNEKVQFSLRSVNEQETNPITQWCVYHQKQKTKAIYLYDSTFVTPLSLLLFGGKIQIHETQTGHTNDCEVTIDDWITFHSSKRNAELVKELRRELDKLLEYKISHPGPTVWNSNTKEGALLRAIVDLLETEKIETLENRERMNGIKR